MAASRIVFHVDMDAFYASCELKEHPEWRGKPLIVGADPREGRGRGVVLTASYEARKYGVRSGMPISLAYRMCKDPETVYVHPHFDLYVRTSREAFETVRSFADAFESWGIDEGFLDVTARAGTWDGARTLAAELKATVRARNELVCSVGAAPNKSVAKIASDFGKPDGLVVVEPDRVESFLAPIPVSSIFGVGKKTASRLEALGIRTIGDLAAYPREELEKLFGSWAGHMADVSHGIDDSPVEPWTGPPKSIGSETTFDEDTRDPEIVGSIVASLIDDVHARLLSENLSYRTVGLKARFEDFETFTRARTLRVHSREKEPIVERARAMLREFLEDGRNLRLVGVRVADLTEDQPKAVSLSRFG